MKIKRKTTGSEKKLIASVDKEMQEPRLAESVREAEQRTGSPATEQSTAHAAWLVPPQVH
ncbi:hypothetical protein HDF16_006160 [Granulicella aggregans]|uniref:Uncharacterized protein n=1 Tax=Granulicella aggregans TaxID=474949 RepID=A0A7W7ZKU0_9BACT|nr:hypothetical protein [Granulicella aggregans]